MGFFFWAEVLVFLASAAIFLRQGPLGRPHQQLQAALLAMLGGTLYRIDVFLVAYDPGNGWIYFPSLAEILVTLGLIATETVVYVLVVRKFPILAGATSAPRREVPAVLKQGATT
jgi:Ni/Fe-hydrogenase subunit HybB-like protein